MKHGVLNFGYVPCRLTNTTASPVDLKYVQSSGRSKCRRSAIFNTLHKCGLFINLSENYTFNNSFVLYSYLFWVISRSLFVYFVLEKVRVI